MDYKDMTPEQLREELVKRDETVNTMQDDVKTSKAILESNESRIKSLEEHNQKLFLRVTTKVEDKKEDNQEPEKRTIAGLIEKMEGDKK